MDEKKEYSLEEKWEALTLADNFIFYKVMRHHPDACRHLIEILLGIRIEKFEISNEETIEIDYDSKSIRLDVFVKDAERMFDIEIQVANTGELPERARYYQGVMDLDSLKSGQKYRELKDSHVIFLCMNDIFGRMLPVYDFENICLEDNNLKLNDRSYKHFFIVPSCAKISEDNEVRDFCNFLVSNRVSGKFTRVLKTYVNDAKHNEQWRMHYMTWERQRAYDLEEGLKRGREEGARETAIENAKKALSMALTVEQVSQITSLSLEQVLAIKKELHPGV